MWRLSRNREAAGTPLICEVRHEFAKYYNTRGAVRFNRSRSLADSQKEEARKRLRR